MSYQTHGRSNNKKWNDSFTTNIQSNFSRPLPKKEMWTLVIKNGKYQVISSTGKLIKIKEVLTVDLAE